jgi:hypothetical protein
VTARSRYNTSRRPGSAIQARGGTRCDRACLGLPPPLDRYVNPFTSVPVPPSGFVTVTSTLPGTWGGVMAEILLLLATTTLVAAAEPKVIVAPAAKFAPWMVTLLPPAAGPEEGFSTLIEGATPVKT